MQQIDLELMVGLTVFAFGVGGLVGGYMARGKERYWWQDEMIRRRHAVYHWENGKWYWNEDEPPTPRDPAATKAKNIMTFRSSTAIASLEETPPPPFGLGGAG